jgi:hypothetical protein
MIDEMDDKTMREWFKRHSKHALKFDDLIRHRGVLLRLMNLQELVQWLDSEEQEEIQINSQL